MKSNVTVPVGNPAIRTLEYRTVHVGKQPVLSTVTTGKVFHRLAVICLVLSKQDMASAVQEHPETGHFT